MKPYVFLVSLTIWSAFVLAPLTLIVIARSGFPVDEMLHLMLLAFLGTVIVAAVLLAAGRTNSQVVASCLGLVVGAVLPPLTGLGLGVIEGGFETPAILFWLGLLIAVPSGLAGAVIGWYARRKAHR